MFSLIFVLDMFDEHCSNRYASWMVIVYKRKAISCIKIYVLKLGLVLKIGNDLVDLNLMIWLIQKYVKYLNFKEK